MNIETYFIDESSKEVFITVTVSTPGIAVSSAEITFSNGKTVKIPPSTNGTGIIPKTSLGSAENLINTLIEVDTDIKLDLVPSSDWPSCYENLVIKYYLQGGVDDSNQPFVCNDEDKHKSVSGKTIGAEKYILLTTKPQQ